ncbi:thermonuclease family protein [Bacillus subtilis]|uniref:thermonuclease family protein n=1 Tax=Bacillus subtilis TaxID=1423 RepID=UPI002795BBF5|nr:hypothetical protein [Bacillus subtilis]
MLSLLVDARLLVAVNQTRVDISDKIEVTVSRVIDGDTFTVDVKGTEERILLILVDTPETVYPTMQLYEKLQLILEKGYARLAAFPPNFKYRKNTNKLKKQQR